MSTLHRRDISSSDLTCLAKFIHALLVITGPNGKLPWELGNVTMVLPVWYQCASGWQLSNYKEFEQEALGIMVPDFRRVCRHIRVSEHQMISSLYRLSMISMVKGQSLSEHPKFKQSFYGFPISLGGVESSTEFGYVVERRRLEGNFRKR